MPSLLSVFVIVYALVNAMAVPVFHKYVKVMYYHWLMVFW